jgi:5-methylcytosine-specific restriction endonuclease McrA
VPPLGISDELRVQIAAVTNRRARFVLDYIVEHGHITADDIQRAGYREHRRAVMDCRDLGFPIINSRVRSPQGGTVGAWTLDPDGTVGGRAGRRQYPRAFRLLLLARANGRCEVCGAPQADRNLQIDHRIPFEIDPGSGELVPDEYQMLCGSCNRTKSRTCETDCPNWQARDPEVCRTCMWASPDDYQHIATIPRRQVTLTWVGDDVGVYDELRAAAESAGEDVTTFLRRRLTDD